MSERKPKKEEEHWKDRVKREHKNLRRQRVRALAKLLRLYDDSTGVNTYFSNVAGFSAPDDSMNLAKYIDAIIRREACIEHDDEPGYVKKLPDIEDRHGEVMGAAETIADGITHFMKVLYEL